MRANVEYKFGESEECAFEQLKMLLCEKAVLPLYRLGADIELHLDMLSTGYEGNPFATLFEG